MPSFLRWPLAKIISSRRAPIASEIYTHIGGSSPLLSNTEAQALSLDSALAEMLSSDGEAKTFIAMRCWHPMSDETAQAVAAYAPDEIALLPLYPQFSTTTTGSSLEDWYRAACRAGLTTPTRAICCYPHDDGFVSGIVNMVADALFEAHGDNPVRVLFSAHGLPERTINSGDPYQWQIEVTVAAIVDALERRDDLPPFEVTLCYQSQVGPFKWIGPSTESENERAGTEGAALVVVPIAFVSEHMETLVELDIEHSGVPDYIRVPTVSTGGSFIIGLAKMVLEACSRGSAHIVSARPTHLPIQL